MSNAHQCLKRKDGTFGSRRFRGYVNIQISLSDFGCKEVEFIYLFIWLRRAGQGRTVMDRVTKFRVHDMRRITGFIA